MIKVGPLQSSEISFRLLLCDQALYELRTILLVDLNALVFQHLANLCDILCFHVSGSLNGIYDAKSFTTYTSCTTSSDCDCWSP